MSPRLRAALYAQAGPVFSFHPCLYAGDRPTAGRSRFATILPGDAAVSPSNGDHAGTQWADPPPPRNGPKHRGAGRSRSATGPPRQSRSTRQFFCAEVLSRPPANGRWNALFAWDEGCGGKHAGKIEAHGGRGGTGRVARLVEIGAARRGGPGAGDPIDAGGAARRGDRRSSRCAPQHGAELAGLFYAWRRGGAAAAPAARTAGQDRAACRGDCRGDSGRRYAPRWRLDAGAAVCRDRPARRADDLAAVAGAPIAPKGFAWRRPRHTLKGRQDAAAVETSRQRLADLKVQAAAGAIDLVFLDESEALTHPYLARCWARRGTELRIQAPGQARKRAMLGAFDPLRRHLLVHTSATKRSTDFVALLDHLGAAYGTTERARPLVAVLDNGPIHRSKLTIRALAERPWLTLEWLPKYAPELNDIERCWRDLKQHQLANRTFADPDTLARAIPDAVARLNHERQHKSSPLPKRAA